VNASLSTPVSVPGVGCRRKVIRMQIPLRPVDSVSITTLMDNSSDALLPDEGLVRRWGLNGTAGPLPIVPNGMSSAAAGPTSCAPSTASRR